MNHEDRKHATYSPSSMAQIINCPISKYLDKDIPDDPPSKYAAEGTLAHEIAEKYLKKKLLGEEITQECEDIEMHNHCLGYAEFVYNLVEPYLDFKHVCRIEEVLVVYDNLDVWGTADFVFYYKDPTKETSSVFVVDFKYGRGVAVSAEDNWQLLTYAIGACNTSLGFDLIGEVTTYIYQPRVEEVVTSKKYNILELSKYKNKIYEVVNAIEDFKEKGVTQIDYEVSQKEGYWCRWCKVKDTCALANQKKVNRIKAMFEKHNAKHGLLSDEDITFLVANRSALKSMIEGVYKATYKQALEGKEFKGLKLVESNARREFLDDEELVAKGLIELGIEEPFEKINKLITITEAEKILDKGSVDHLCKPRDTKSYSLVSSESDSPEANIKNDMASMFEAKLKQL